MVIKPFGVGFGVFIIALLWVLAIFIYAVLSKAPEPVSSGGWAAVFIAASITIILICIPRELEEAVVKEEVVIHDSMFIWRTCLVVLMGLCCIAGFLIMITHWMEPIFAKPMNIAQF